MEKKFIYRTEYFQWEESDDVLNAFGNEGWELVSVVSKSLNYVEQSSGIPNSLDFLSPVAKQLKRKLENIKGISQERGNQLR